MVVCHFDLHCIIFYSSVNLSSQKVALYHSSIDSVRQFPCEAAQPIQGSLKFSKYPICSKILPLVRMKNENNVARDRMVYFTEYFPQRSSQVGLTNSNHEFKFPFVHSFIPVHFFFFPLQLLLTFSIQFTTCKDFTIFHSF